MDTSSTVTSKTGIQKIGKTVTNELPKVKDANINLRDRLNDMLLTEKHNLVSYQVGINEIINDDLRNLLMDNRNRIQTHHNILFDEMFNLGEYQADAVVPAQLADTAQVFNNYKTQLPYQ